MSFRLIFELMAIGALCYGVYRRVNSGPLPIKFRSFDELECVSGVARWAQSQFGSDDPRARAFWLVAIRVDSPWTIYLPFMVRISAEELAKLVPYIDQAIDGKLPKQDLPSEYVDWRPAVLRDFRARMQNEGFWPQIAVK